MATITVTGDLAADPEVVRIHSGREVTRLRIIENRRRLNRETGTWEDAEPNVFRVQALDLLGTIAAQTLRSGMTVDVVGHVVTDRWPDKDTGQDRTAQTVIADSLVPNPNPGTSTVREQGNLYFDQEGERLAAALLMARDLGGKTLGDVHRWVLHPDGLEPETLLRADGQTTAASVLAAARATPKRQREGVYASAKAAVDSWARVNEQGSTD